mgnify:CR=1 FL=1|tara:strand:+ start:317 stop:844 length:528 start_codon:yes stop_codon:yes gene_type:complete
MDYLIIDFLSPYLVDDCIKIILDFKKELEFFDNFNLIYTSILSYKNKKKIILNDNIDLNYMIYYLDNYKKDMIEKYHFHLYIYDNYGFCQNRRMNYDELSKFTFNGALNINSIQRINNKRILLVLDEDYTKLDNLSKITKGCSYYFKRLKNQIYIQMNIVYITLCYARNPFVSNT